MIMPTDTQPTATEADLKEMEEVSWRAWASTM